MVHIYGHSFTTRWGTAGEEKLVQAYSNCDETELFLKAKSCGVRKRESRDFPSAGLRWNVVFNKGENVLKVIGRKNKTVVSDEIKMNYQTEKWSSPAKFQLNKIDDKNGTAIVQATLVDANNIPCLDAMNKIIFGITGDGRLIDNQGTSTGSSSIQLSNGKAIIKLNTNKGKSVVSVSSQGLPTTFMEVQSNENGVF